jgi:threonine aldolase
MSSAEAIDLRSDTVTRPTPAMREAMARAAVGDDVYGEDPTVRALEQRACALTGKESALFMASGTMANQVAVRAHTEPGDALLTAPDAHVVAFEGGGVAALSGVQPILVGADGVFTGDDVRAALRPLDSHFPRLRLVCMENTHNRAGGRVVPREAVESVARVAREAELALHLDGARVFNASVCSGVAVHELARPFDSVSFCLSKGLGAPVGSLLCGSSRFIARAHRFRKMFGGGLRQAGILAAAGLHALDHHVKDLADDHARARRLADGLRGLPGIGAVPEPQTNIVVFEVAGGTPAPAFVERLRQRGVLLGAISPSWVRAVTHRDVDTPAIERALAAIRGAAA